LAGAYTKGAGLMQVPKYTSKFLYWALPPNLKEPVLGDLTEEYVERRLTNPISARIWFQNQAVRSAFQFLWKTKRGFIMFVFSILAFVGFTLFAMILSGGIDMFIDAPSFLIVVPPALIFGLAATSMADVKRGISILTMSDDMDYSILEYKRAGHFFNVTGNSAMLLGAVMTLIGWIAIGSELPAADFSTVFGPAFAVSILTMVLGLAIKIICHVAQEKIRYLAEFY